jgi:class 3 adenylate cyclase/CheY-like chemotaxis protein
MQVVPLREGVYALCESGLAKSINHIFWENAILEEVVGQAVEQTAAAMGVVISPRNSDEGRQYPRNSTSMRSPRGSNYARGEIQHGVASLGAENFLPGDFLNSLSETSEFGLISRSSSRASLRLSGGGNAGQPLSCRPSSMERDENDGGSGGRGDPRMSRMSSGGSRGGSLRGGEVFEDASGKNIDNWLEDAAPQRRRPYDCANTKFPLKDLSKLPSHYDQEGFLEILLVDSDMAEVEQVCELAASMGAKVTHCKDPQAVLNLFSPNQSGGIGRASSSKGLRLEAAAGVAAGTSGTSSSLPPAPAGPSSAAAAAAAAGSVASPRDRRKVRPDLVFVGNDSEWKEDWLALVKWLDTTFKGKLPQILLVTPEFISADTDDGVMSKAMSSGAEDFMIRPIYRVSLKTRVQNLLKIKEGKRVREERDEMEKLLHRMLPQRVMDQLLSGQGVIADSHPDVTLLFADIVGFTAISSSIPTSEIILILNELFCEFDRAVDLADVYKVETIGDCYMCAAGHDGSDHHADRMVDMARRMIDAVQTFSSPHDIRIRIGIHTGNVFTGIVGTKCPRWCFFGDTVNTASRMESTSFPMCIQISDSTHEALAEDGSDVEAVALPVAREIKGKGSMETFLIKHGLYQEALRDQRGEADVREAGGGRCGGCGRP